MVLAQHEKITNARLYKAFDLMAAKDLENAAVELNDGLAEALDQEDTVLSAVFYSTLGVLAKMRREFQEAWRYYEKAEKLLPEDPALKLIAAKLLIEVFGQYDTAIRRSEKVLELSPNDPPFRHQALATKGLAHLKSGQMPEALKCLVQASEEGFAGLISAGNIDMKLAEALVRKKTGVTECRAYLAQALAFAEETEEEKFIQLFTRLLSAFDAEFSETADDDTSSPSQTVQ